MEQYYRMAGSSSVYDPFGGSSSSMGALEGMGVWMIIALVLAVIGGILVYFLFVKAKTEPKGKFLKWLKDFLAFKTMWIEAILKVAYYVITIFCVLYSFALIPVSFISFIGMLIVVPIVIRLIYEFSMMFIMIWRNTTDLAKKK